MFLFYTRRLTHLPTTHQASFCCLYMSHDVPIISLLPPHCDWFYPIFVKGSIGQCLYFKDNPGCLNFKQRSSTIFVYTIVFRTRQGYIYFNRNRHKFDGIWWLPQKFGWWAIMFPSFSHIVPHIFLIKMAKTLKTPSFRHANSVQRGTDNISASLRLRRNSRCLNAEVSRLKIEMDRSYGSKYLSV